MLTVPPEVDEPLDGHGEGLVGAVSLHGLPERPVLQLASRVLGGSHRRRAATHRPGYPHGQHWSNPSHWTRKQQPALPTFSIQDDATLVVSQPQNG